MWDQSWYGEVSSDLFYSFIHDIVHWYQAMIVLIPSKPPLLVWVGQFFVPIGLAIGNIEIALLFFVLLTQLFVLLCIWAIAKEIAREDIWLQLFAISLAGSGSLFIGLTHQFLVEPLQLLCASASLLLALRAQKLELARLITFLVILIMVGFSTKTTSIVYCGFSWTYCVWIFANRMVFKGELISRTGLPWVWIFVACAMTVITAHWYIANIVAVLDHIKNATIGASAELYGKRSPLLLKLPFWLVESNRAFFGLPYLLLPLLGLAGAKLIYLQRHHPRIALKSFMPAIEVVCFAQVILPVIMLASQPPEETRYLLAILPSIVVLALFILQYVEWVWLKMLLTLALLLQAALFNAVALGANLNLVSSSWLWPVKTDKNDSEVAARIQDETCRVYSDRVNVIGPEFPQMNANSISLISSMARYASGFRCYYTSLGYAETDQSRAIDRLESLKSPFLVLPNRELKPEEQNAFNQILKAFNETIMSGDRYSRVDTVGDYAVFKKND